MRKYFRIIRIAVVLLAIGSISALQYDHRSVRDTRSEHVESLMKLQTRVYAERIRGRLQEIASMSQANARVLTELLPNESNSDPAEAGSDESQGPSEPEGQETTSEPDEQPNEPEQFDSQVADIYNMLLENVAENNLVFGSCVALLPDTYPWQKQRFAPYVYRISDDNFSNQRIPEPCLNTARDDQRKLWQTFFHKDLADEGADYNYWEPKRWEWFGGIWQEFLNAKHDDERRRQILRGRWTSPFLDASDTTDGEVGGTGVAMVTYTVPIVKTTGHGQKTVYEFQGITTVDVRLDTLVSDIFRNEDTLLDDNHPFIVTGRSDASSRGDWDHNTREGLIVYINNRSLSSRNPCPKSPWRTGTKMSMLWPRA